MLTRTRREHKLCVVIVTFKFRIKDATVGKRLNKHAQAVNFVWNYCNQIQREAESRWKAGRAAKWPSAFDLIRLCTGGGADLGLHSDTIQTVCREYVTRRDANGGHLRWRASKGSKRSLGWVPFIPRAVKIDGAHIVYLKRKFFFWKSREIDGTIKAGSFVQDARGRWYVCFQSEVFAALGTGTGKIGIDLGLKSLASCSDGTIIKAPRYYRKYESALALAHRARNKSRVRAIHAKIQNARRHHLHVRTTHLVRKNQFIAVGNASPSRLARTKMAKSILDAGWATLKAQLAYKARRHNAVFFEVDERSTSQTCSRCGEIPDSSPKHAYALVSGERVTISCVTGR